MRKTLLIIALAIITIGLIVGGIICFVQYSNLTGGYGANTDSLTAAGDKLAFGIAMMLGGIGSGIAMIANFFSARTIDKH